MSNQSVSFADDVSLFTNLNSIAASQVVLDRTVGEACATRGIQLAKEYSDLKQQYDTVRDNYRNCNRHNIWYVVAWCAGILACMYGIYGITILQRNEQYKDKIEAKVRSEVKLELQDEYKPLNLSKMYIKDGQLFITE